MTETEKLLKTARDIAGRHMKDPSESAVMDLFRELCAERERMDWAMEVQSSAGLH